jgi:hypothetical protein
MGKIKNELLGDTAPSRAPYQDFGRFRVVVNRQTGKVWIKDMEVNDLGNPYELGKFEAAIGQFCAEEF